MNRVKRLALVTALPVGAALVVAIAPAVAATGAGNQNVPRAAVAGYEMSQLTDEHDKKEENDKKTTPPVKKTTPPVTKTTPPPKTTPPKTTPATVSPTRTALPVTGSDSNPNVIWMVATGLLTAGGALLLLARRLRGRAGA